MNKRNLTISINPAKILFFICILYSEVIAVKWWSIPYLSFALFAVMTAVLFLQYPKVYTNLLFKDKAIIFFLLFIIVNFILSFFTAVNFSVSLKVVINLVQYFMVFIAICVLSKVDKSILFPAKTFIFVLVVMAFILVYSPVNFSERLYSADYTVYLTISSTVNPHSIGVLAVLGVWLILSIIIEQKNSVKHLVLNILLIILFVYITLVTNSRKSFIAIIVMVFLTIIPFIKYLYKKFSTSKFLSIITVCLSFFVLFTIFLLRSNVLVNNNFLNRIIQGMNGESNQYRFYLIIDALRVFKDNFIFGVGFNNYQFHSAYANYSHCTYSELLACCGIFGSVFFVLFGIEVFSKVRLADKVHSEKNKSVCFGFLVVLLFLGFTQIVFYEKQLIYAISFLYAFSCVLLDNNAVNKKATE